MQPVVIGIAGGSGSGKSTLVAAIVDRSPVPVSCVSFDDYYRDHPHLDLSERRAINYDHPDALDADQLAADLLALRGGREVAVTTYDFGMHRRSRDAVIVTPRPLVVVDGILLLAFEVLVGLLDVKVYIDAPDEVRTHRRVERDVADRGRTAAFALDQIAATVRPMHEAFVAPSAARADLVVDGTSSPVTSADRILHRALAAEPIGVDA